jgi:hypothetical protein
MAVAVCNVVIRPRRPELMEPDEKTSDKNPEKENSGTCLLGSRQTLNRKH